MKKLLPYILALGIFGTPLIADEVKPKAKKIQPKTEQISLEEELSKRYHDHDKIILEEMDLVNKACKDIKGYKPFSITDAKLFRAMIMVEGYNYAWNYDPAQVSNSGDGALDDLKFRSGILDLVDDSYFQAFKDVKHAQKDDATWNYTNTGINPRLSIRAGWFNLTYEGHRVNKTFNFGEEKQHEIKSKDSLWKLANKYKLLIPNAEEPFKDAMKLFRQWNPDIDFNKPLNIGDVINYRTGSIEASVLRKDTKQMFEAHNGGGYELKTGREYFNGAIMPKFRATVKTPFKK